MHDRWQKPPWSQGWPTARQDATSLVQLIIHQGLGFMQIKAFLWYAVFFNLDRMRFRFAQFNIHQGLYCWISIFVFSILGFVQSRNWVRLFVGLIESSLISVSNLIPPSKFYNWASVKSYIESLFQYCFISWGIFFNIGIGAAYSLLCGFPDQRL